MFFIIEVTTYAFKSEDFGVKLLVLSETDSLRITL